MSEYRSPRDGRDPYRQDGVRRAPQGSRPSQSRFAGNRSPQGRPAGSRPPQGGRPAGSRPPQGRPAPRRRKKRVSPRLFVFIGILLAIIVVLIVAFGGKGNDKPIQPVASTAVPNASMSATSAADATEPAAAQTDASFSSLTTYLGNADSASVDIDSLGEDDSYDDGLSTLPENDLVQVSDLSINTSLPDTWLNILLLGTDERTLNENSRTDTMIICSINKSTHEVKLTNIMRDTAVVYDDLENYNGTYRINAANFFGGPKYAIKTVNECFDMNIQYYVTVNFFGFQKIAQALGGVTMDITEEEMNQINKYARQQAIIAARAGIDESDQINEYLTQYGEDTLLNGRQTLAYARIRKIDSDFGRVDRQRKVLSALMNKMKERSATEIISMGISMLEYVSTNMDADTIMKLAVGVLGADFDEIQSFRLPVNDSYKQESRNEESMFYDCDWATNARELYSFIYT